MKYHAGVILKTGEIEGHAFETKDEAEEYILEQAEKVGIKRGVIRDLDTGKEEIIKFEDK